MGVLLSMSQLKTHPKSRWQSEAPFLTLADVLTWARVAPHTVLQDKPSSCIFLAGTRPLSPGYSSHQTTSCTKRLEGCTCPGATADLSGRGTVSAGVCSEGRRPVPRWNSLSLHLSHRDRRPLVFPSYRCYLQDLILLPVAHPLLS